MKLTSRQIGAVGVARVTGALLRCGYSVLTPYEDFAGYDVVAEKNNKFYRIQVKTAQAVEHGRTKYRFTTSVGNGFNIPKRAISGVDYVACWGMNDDLFWLLPIGKCRSLTTKLCPSTGGGWRVFKNL